MKKRMIIIKKGMNDMHCDCFICQLKVKLFMYLLSCWHKADITNDNLWKQWYDSMKDTKYTWMRELVENTYLGQ